VRPLRILLSPRRSLAPPRGLSSDLPRDDPAGRVGRLRRRPARPRDGPARGDDRPHPGAVPPQQPLRARSRPSRGDVAHRPRGSRRPGPAWAPLPEAVLPRAVRRGTSAGDGVRGRHRRVDGVRPSAVLEQRVSFPGVIAMSDDCCGGFSRRDLLKGAACGFGLTALRHLFAEASDDPLAPRPSLQPARARRVIFLFMHGGPSHMDTFDYKPRLQADHDKTLPYAIPRLQKAQGRNLGKLLASPFSFSRYGKGGLWISELFPRIAERADDLCVLNGMHTDGVDHGQAINRLHTGSDTLVRPSLGAWVSYGLGTENRNLPGFVTISPLKGDTGVRSYSNAFLPAAFQGTPIGSEGLPARSASVRHLANDRVPPDRQRLQLELLRRADEEHAASRPGDDRLDGMIRSFELAFRMQAAAPPVLDLSGETEETLKLYGIGQEPTDNFGRQCLLARRMAEAGVRYIQVTHTQLQRD